METVSVTVTVRDPEAGERRQEEREVLRSKWKADLVDALAEGSSSTLLRAWMRLGPGRSPGLVREALCRVSGQGLGTALAEPAASPAFSCARR